MPFHHMRRTTRLLSSTSILLPITTCLPSARARGFVRFLGRSYEWKRLGVHGASLYQKLVSPTIQRFETLGVVDIVNQYAAVSPTVEGYT
jgi:hypothetical protein